MTVYRYISQDDFSVRHPLLSGVDFQADWLRITPDGTLTIPKGYAWDGCTPSFYLGFWLGTPELWTGKDGERVTYRASQVHDALCQYAEHLPITKQTASEIFRRMLIDKGVPAWLARLYYFGVMAFGPQVWGNDGSENN